MELLQRLPFPRRLAARVWLLTLPSALLSFERRQRIPRLPVGRGRLLGLGLIATGVALILRGQGAGALPGAGLPGLSRLRHSPTVVGGLLVLSGAGLLVRSLMLIVYAFGLAFAFARDAVDLEEPQLGGRGADEDWEYDETNV